MSAKRTSTVPLGNRREGNERCACAGKGCAAVIEISFSVDEVALSVTLFGCTRGDIRYTTARLAATRPDLNDVECHNSPARGRGIEPDGPLSGLALEAITAAKPDEFCGNGWTRFARIQRGYERETVEYRTASIEPEAMRRPAFKSRSEALGGIF